MHPSQYRAMRAASSVVAAPESAHAEEPQLEPVHGGPGRRGPPTEPPGAYLNEDDVLLTRLEAAKYLRVAVSTMERWAREGRGPKPIYVGRRALYSLATLRSATGAKAA
jgi:hypothetical protein